MRPRWGRLQIGDVAALPRVAPLRGATLGYVTAALSGQPNAGAAVRCSAAKNLTRSQAEATPNLAGQILRLFRVRDNGEHRRPPRTLADAVNPLLPDKRYQFRQPGMGVNSALHRRKRLADAGVKIVKRFAEGRQISIHESGEQTEQDQPAEGIGGGQFHAPVLQLLECLPFEFTVQAVGP